MSDTWDSIFNVENVEGYFRASEELLIYLKVLIEEGYTGVVIPSRGVLPIYRLAKNIWFNDLKAMPNRDDRVAEKYKWSTSPIMSPVIIPFSADPKDAKEDTKSIRKFWSCVLAALVLRKGDDKFLLFYRFLVENVAKKSWESVLPRKLPNEKFIFIDTVVSGRAIVEILDSLESIGLNDFYLILVVDENGERIKENYLTKIEKYESEGRCQRIKVKNLFTEDRGPAVSGVWSLVYPKIMSSLRERYDWAENCYGAGTFYHKVSSGARLNGFKNSISDYNLPLTRMYSSLNLCYYLNVALKNQLKYLMDGGVGRELLDFDKRMEKAVNDIRKQYYMTMLYILKEMIDEFNAIPDMSPVNQNTTKKMAYPRIKEIWSEFDLNVSSSHLLRLDFSDEEINRLFSLFEREYLRGKDAFSTESDWFLF
ncbi:hypothetical protein [uncultured Thiothrix sp.]|uniref:hypothetical protein n=1 Tax=uncultured Thiothrix sp. TaxID=223185 RepID=UPI002611FA72|nr:hypothetical protein [uncultured Thiothrix sp.]